MKRIAGLLIAFTLFATGAYGWSHGATPAQGQGALEFSSVASTAIVGDVVSNITGLDPSLAYTLTNSAGGEFSLTGSHLFVASALTVGTKSLQLTGTAVGRTPEVVNLSLTVAAPTVTSVGAALDRSTFMTDFDGNFTSGLSLHSPWQTGDLFSSYYAFGYYGNYSSRALPPTDLTISVDPSYLGLGLKPYSISDGILKGWVGNTPVASLGTIGAVSPAPYPFQYYQLTLTTEESFNYAYGCIEVREQPMSGNGALNGVWPAFYAILQPAAGNKAETDVFEYYGSNGFTSGDVDNQTIHYDPNGGTSNASAINVPGHALGYHTYTFCRNSTNEWWYYDGVMTKTTFVGDAGMSTNSLSQFYMIVTLGSASTGTTFAGNYSPAVTPPGTVVSQIQYVRHYTFTGPLP